MPDSTTINVVVDISHHNSNPDLAAAKASGIEGVIHKAREMANSTEQEQKGRPQAAARSLRTPQRDGTRLVFPHEQFIPKLLANMEIACKRANLLDTQIGLAGADWGLHSFLTFGVLARRWAQR